MLSKTNTLGNEIILEPRLEDDTWITYEYNHQHNVIHNI